MAWINFEGFALISLICWLAAIILLLAKGRQEKTQNIAVLIASIGSLVLLSFVVLLWIRIERPPMRTLGETRLWYSLLLPIIGIISFTRWRYNWLLIYSLGMGMLFVSINLLRPETHDKSLMPALISYWFVPHVIVYMFAYALLAASCLTGIKALYMNARKKSWSEIPELADNFVYLGFSCLTMGLLFGAMWAKEAWGHYWTWDPKETWALISVLVYAVVLHLRLIPSLKSALVYNLASLWAFSSIIMTSFGVNYYLAGLHSYAKGDPVPVPLWVYYSAALLIIISIAAAWRYRGLNNNQKRDLRI